MASEHTAKRWDRKLHSLMPFRVREVLLVSSEYDAFVLEEDGPITDRLFQGYTELNLSWAPRLTHANSVSKAMAMMGTRRFDMVITVVRIQDTDAAAFSRDVKLRYPFLPVVLLAFEEGDLRAFPGGAPPATLDQVFLWTGDARCLLAVIKLLEDHTNVEHDTGSADVPIILVVEDSLRVYSHFLALLYPELLAQSHSLIAEGLNDLHRLMRMRGRPKILLANSYDEAIKIYRKYAPHIFAVITDADIPRRALPRRTDAGVALARLIRTEKLELPILIQSAQSELAVPAREVTCWFIDKNSPDVPQQLSAFLREGLGFGDFVFRIPDRTEVGRAADIYELEQLLRIVPAESLAYHASLNHFSLWLKARGMYWLAASLRPRKVEEFTNLEDYRRFFITLLQEDRMQQQEGVITDFSPRQTGEENRFVRIGRGSIGGKGRSIAFVSSQIASRSLFRAIPGLEISVPKSVVVGTEEFDRFLAHNPVNDLLAGADDREIALRIISGQLRPEFQTNLRAAFTALRGPLAVRSSSLLEDSRFQPFAGIYATYMLPNNHPDPEVRFTDLRQAVKAVYASAFSRDARTYVAGTPHEIDDQKMAVVIQQVVGRPHGTRFYPQLSGVAQSFNFYPVGGQRPEEGIAAIALGLGHMVVGGGQVLSFSPGAPNVLPQFPDTAAVLRNTQLRFYAVDLARPRVDLFSGPEASLIECDLETAEQDGMLELAGSVYCAGDDVFRETMTAPGPRVVTFANLLKWNALPLAKGLRTLLEVLRDGVGGEVEIEFALDLRDWGQDAPRGQRRRLPRLFVLQVRPLAAPEYHRLEFDPLDLPAEEVFCRADKSLGDGVLRNVRDVVYVTKADVDSSFTRAAARDVSAVNERLTAEERPYLLIGPGRWGTSDPSLGVPVNWADIAGVRAIIESPMGGHHVEPSQGTHFFNNVTAKRIGYLTLCEGAGSFLDVEWLGNQPALTETERVRHVRLEQPLVICLDGLHGTAMILKSLASLPNSVHGNNQTTTPGR